MIAAISPQPHGPDWSAVALIIVVALTPMFAILLTFQLLLKNWQMRLGTAVFAFGTAAAAALWMWRNPAKVDELGWRMVDNGVTFGYPAAVLSVLIAVVKLGVSPTAISSVARPSVESLRRKRTLLAAAVCMSGLIVAVAGFWWIAPPWRWILLIAGSLTASAATVSILFVVRRRAAPHDRAIAQSNGTCVKPGHLYQPKDDDRYIPIRRRTSSFPSHVDLESRTLVISWTPHPDHLSSFAANFENDEKVDAKLNEWVAMRLSVTKIKRKAHGLGILIEEVDATRIRQRSRGLPDAR